MAPQFFGYTIQQVIWPSKYLPGGGYRDSLGDFVGSPNNLVPRSAKQSAIDVTAKAIFERLVLVPEWRSVAKFNFMPSAPTLPPLTLHVFLDFTQFILEETGT